MKSAQEIEILIRAKYPVLYVITWEEDRLGAALTDIAHRLNKTVCTWSLTQGMKPAAGRLSDSEALKSPRLSAELVALSEILTNESQNAIYHLKDFHPYMNDTRVIRLLRDLANQLRSRSQTIVISSPIMKLPIELEKEISVLEFALPDESDIGAVLDTAIQAVSNNTNVDTKLSDERRELLIKSCLGLTLDEVESVFARSLVEVKKFDLSVVLEEKKQIVRKSGLLEYYPASESFSNVGGMEILKEWLDKRKASFTDKARAFGLPAPKGVLLLGVQGCGKSLIAKAISSAWNLPMLKMDVGRIFGSLVGQSEENIRKAIRVAESVAPCILWADELEKGFAGTQSSGVSDGGTTARVFATFLTWMQDKTAPVFLIATANDVSQLPPELLRKGRFDEIFFIDLPDSQEREEIFAIHLKKRKRDPKNFNLKTLSEKTNGFSGAEIEQAVIASLFVAYDANRELIQEDLESETETAVPLSVMMEEEINQLRNWAKLRARPAGKNDDETVTTKR